MDRREFLQKSGMGLVGLALSQVPERLLADVRSANKRPPNFVFILADQWRWDALGCSGNKLMHTPNVDRLAADGVRFDNCYCAQAVCSPSRASIVTGVYPFAHKVRDNIYNTDDVTSMPGYNMRATWPLLLQQAGYYTGYVGKWHLGEKGPKCFDEWHGFNSLLSHWLGEPYKSRYRSDAEAEQGMRFLEQNKDRPFVLYQSFYPPHTPYTAPKRYWPYYENTDLKPMEYYAACSAIDWNIGRILAKLEELDLTDNTFVIFSADHGDHFKTRPGGAQKRGAYDDCARVPLIVHHPRLAHGGQVRSELVSNVDFMPTILDVAGLPQPGGIHGSSLVPLLAGKEVPWRDAVVIVNREDVAQDNGKKKPTCNSRGVRTRDFKLILRDRLSTGATTLRELYDHSTDPAEHNNIYGKQRSAEIVPILEKLESWANTVHDSEALGLVDACRADLGVR